MGSLQAMLGPVATGNTWRNLVYLTLIKLVSQSLMQELG